MATIVVMLALVAQSQNRVRDPLTERHLETPTFGPTPADQPLAQTVWQVWADLQTPAGTTFFHRLLPTQAGALWIALLVTVAVAVDTTRPFGARNLDLLALLVLGALFFDVLRFFDLLLDPTYFQVMDWVFTGIVTTSAFLAARAVWRVRHPLSRPWQPNLRTRSLVALTMALLTLNALTVVIREPDDAGFYTNLGAQRLRERGLFPYGDPLLTGSPGAAYGPVLFLAHVPFQWILDPVPLNTRAGDRPLEEGRTYYLPPIQASQLTTLTFHLIGVAALIAATRRLAGRRVAWGLAALYCSSAFVLGVGGSAELVGGLTFISHTAAPALALVAFACLERPFLAGLFLALSVATVFYPLFFIPAWLGYYWRQPAAPGQFGAGMALAALMVGGPLLARSQPIEGHSLLGTIVRETVGHHQGSESYGTTPFGFWGARGGARAWLQRELVPGQAVTTPMFLLVAGIATLLFIPARRSTPPQLALLSATAAILVNVWKILGTGVYVSWYLAFLLIGLFASPPPRSAEY
jgi:hypothetical protein